MRNFGFAGLEVNRYSIFFFFDTKNFREIQLKRHKFLFIVVSLSQTMGAYKVSNRSITTFSITSSPIIYRAKALAYMTILTSKLLASHPALTDFKKRQKLHFCNKNFKNDFSFPDVFVFNIATTPSSSSYHLIQLFKYYKTMPFSKIRNTDHCANYKEKHSKRPMLYIFSHILAIFDCES